MKIIEYLSNLMIPFVVFYIVGFGLLMNRNVYEDFLTGAKRGLHTVIQILPALVGLMVAVGVLRNSGLLEKISELFEFALEKINIPGDIVPLSVVRLFSSSAAVSLLMDIFKEYGTDSVMGNTASILMSCTESVFYCMAVYFGTVGIKKTRWTLPGALAATIAGIAASILLGKLISL